MIKTAKVLGLKRFLIPLPFLSISLSSYWLNLFTPVPFIVAKALIEESLVRFEALLQDSEKIVTVETLGELTSWLVEQYSSRPTPGPEDSLSGQ